ncbi:3ef62d6c-8f19-4184-8bf3-80f8be438e71 [Thermothielavioides terrestris]|uniref:Uncharacterized protein n=2 Tax=Thermothielavioides terrestris TaxID=2587410 RepID=G2R106_THETT|nr:uncharacterized protein THITE_110591 [Thermothielavioides terrestris NRRL 8126]AEO66503.1 hypothetical protein THITE_110591 [Thermothielavioides terrestris NRRL 8126]SPQ20264.1 3ef62d6c-8f19-4184-8bf3-80f8be438e71 [Thermothielavioides terrestris]
MSASVLKQCLPNNGLKWLPDRHVTRNIRVDTRVVAALRSLRVSIRKRDVEIELTNLIDKATSLARRRGRDVDRSEFVYELRHYHRLGRYLSPDDFEQLFTTIVLARYRYVEDRWEEDLPEEDPATHCHLARAVDRFNRAARFWCNFEAFFEDDHTRAEEAEMQAANARGNYRT